MFQKQKLFVLFLLLSFCTFSFSQTNLPKKKSSEVYRDIQTYSKKRKFTKLLHKLIFEPINPKKKKKKIVPNQYKNFEGKIIRNINIITLDPFGFSEIDSTRKPKNWAEQTGNRLHLKTKNLAIQNLILIRKNKPLDSLLLKESERLIRTQKYVNKLSINVLQTYKNIDSVDVYIRVLDSWSIIPKASVSNSKTTLEFNEKNFMGIVFIKKMPKTIKQLI